MNEFKGYHPIVNCIYFVFVISFSVFYMHPIFVVINLISSVLYVCIDKKLKLFFVIPLIVVLAIIYPLHNHQGITMLAYFPDGNSFTLESALYGLVRAISVFNVICWFSSFFTVITTDKLLYLLGKITPALSLIISMTLRFVPRFVLQTKKVIYAQRGMGKDIRCGSIAKRFKLMLTIFSVMITWSVENSFDISDSMKARGYGVGERTSFSIYKLYKRDVIAIVVILFLESVVFLNNKPYYSYFPIFGFSLINSPVFVIYLVLCMIPIIIKIYENIFY